MLRNTARIFGSHSRRAFRAHHAAFTAPSLSLRSLRSSQMSSVFSVPPQGFTPLAISSATSGPRSSITQIIRGLQTKVGESTPESEVIVGNGIIGGMEAYAAFKKGSKRITVIDKNKSIQDSTACNIAPSLTPDEILSVVPHGQALTNALQKPFNEPGGIRIDDVPEVKASSSTQKFLKQADMYSQDELGHVDRTKTLLEIGKRSMDMWEDLYRNADPKLQGIFKKSNFNPCREPDGYRIDIMKGIPDAQNVALKMQHDYNQLGYNQCQILSPAEVKKENPYLADFCHLNSSVNTDGNRAWVDSATALKRPGGCINVNAFLPDFYNYIKQEMGQYTDSNGEVKDCFQMQLGREVTGVDLNPEKSKVIGLQFADNTSEVSPYPTNYVFCPGENIGFMTKAGFAEPAYAGFAGVSLKLNIPVPADQIEKFAKLNNWMEVHKVGVVLAWQARFLPEENKIFLAVGGTKALYGDQRPQKDQAFAQNRLLLQLNIINEVMPEILSLALCRDTKGLTLTAEDLGLLHRTGIATSWVGRRSLAYDGFPTLGKVYTQLRTPR